VNFTFLQFKKLIFILTSMKCFSDNMKSDRVPLKPPRMTTGGVQRIQKRPEISNTQHTSSFDDGTDSNRRGNLR
jgi:hypothetical protein